MTSTPRGRRFSSPAGGSGPAPTTIRFCQRRVCHRNRPHRRAPHPARHPLQLRRRQLRRRQLRRRQLRRRPAPTSPTPTSPSPTTVASANLAVALTDSPDPVKTGRRLNYNATVTNVGPAAGTSTVLTDTLPNGVTLISATSSQGSCTVADRTVTCALGSIVQGLSVSVKIVVAPTSVGQIDNTVSVSSTTADPVSANNVSSVTTTVRGDGRARSYSSPLLPYISTVPERARDAFASSNRMRRTSRTPRRRATSTAPDEGIDRKLLSTARLKFESVLGKPDVPTRVVGWLRELDPLDLVDRARTHDAGDFPERTWWRLGRKSRDRPTCRGSRAIPGC